MATRYFEFDSMRDAQRRANREIKRQRQAVGADPDISPDGKPYVTQFAGRIRRSRTRQNSLWEIEDNKLETEPSDLLREKLSKPDEYNER